MSLLRPVLPAAAFAMLFAVPAMTSATPAEAASGARFCIARGGGGEGGGGGYVGNCVYPDYQQCLQAAAEGRGNCVPNIDDHGETDAAPSATAPRSRRRPR